MTPARTLKCAIYTRVSTDQGLEQEFNSLDAQREASEAYIKSQAHEGWRCLPEHYADGGFSGGTLERPALQKLLDAVRDRKADIIVVYKVDRLTRSLADFAKLVELMDQSGVSFVSVTQSFNTTSSMGRLTLNVLLSFAQFEREVTGERIRDKIAASKKKGMWMGGIIPFGFRVEDRKLLVDSVESEVVRLIFARYLALSSIPLLINELSNTGVTSRVRKMSSGRIVGGIPFTTGPLHHMLTNRVYLGEINHRDQSYKGEHDAIITRVMFDSVQAKLSAQRSGRARTYAQSDALLVRLIFDDRGNRMTPVSVNKGPARYRYYQSWVIAQGRKAEAGSIPRVPAEDIERAVVIAVQMWLADRGAAHAALEGQRGVVRAHIVKVVVQPSQLTITLRQSAGDASAQDKHTSDEPCSVLTVPWSRPSTSRRKEILGPESTSGIIRPIRTEARSRLIAAIARGRRWLEQLIDGDVADIAAIAGRENLSDKTIRSMLSLAFLAPDIVQAAIDGRLPRGFGVSQLTDLPLMWQSQRRQLGLVK